MCGGAIKARWRKIRWAERCINNSDATHGLAVLAAGLAAEREARLAVEADVRAIMGDHAVGIAALGWRSEQITAQIADLQAQMVALLGARPRLNEEDLSLLAQVAAYAQPDTWFLSGEVFRNPRKARRAGQALDRARRYFEGIELETSEGVGLFVFIAGAEIDGRRRWAVKKVERVPAQA